MEQKLDKKDFKILYELDINARQSNSSIAKKVGLSKDAVAHRIKKLENKKVLTGYRTLINFSKLNSLMFRTLIKFVDINEKTLKELFSFMKNEKLVWLHGQNEGEWDFAFVCLVKNPEEYYNFYERFSKKFRKIIGDKLTSILLKYEELPRDYLTNKTPNRKIPKIESPKKEKIDEIDSKILEALSKNARKKLIEISDELKLSSMLVLQRIKKLEQKRIIIGYKADLNVLAIGRDYYGIKMNLSNYSEKEQIFQEIYSLPETSAILYNAGGYDLEFDLELIDTNHYHEIINKLRNKFSTIREIKSMRAVKYSLSNNYSTSLK